MEESWLQVHFPKHQHLFDGIDLESFLNLKPDDFKDVLPNFVQRAIFKNQYDKFVKMINMNVIDPSDVDETLVEIPQADVGHVFDSGTNQIIDLNPRSSNVERVELIDVVNSSTINVVETQDQNLPTRQIKTAQDIVNIPSIPLKIVIRKQELNQPLDNIDRITIGKAIIHELLIPNLERVITSKEFSELSAAIVELFPTEIRGCYFTPSHCELQAQGKLYSAYSKFKSNLRAVGLIKKRLKAEKRLVSNGENTDENIVGSDATESLKYVLEETDNFEQIIKCWVDSYEERHNRFLRKLTASDYIKTFPAFDIARGFELLCIDAELSIGSTISSKLPLIAKKVLIFAKRQKKHSLEVEAILNYHDELVSSGLDDVNLSVCEQLTAIKLIPHMLCNPKKGRSKRKSKVELTQLFCPCYETRMDLLEKHPNVVEKFPQLMCIGQFLSITSELRIADKTYLIENPITGFDILFKSILGLSLNYPAETQHLWIFIQKAVYNISRPHDVYLAGVETFIQELNNIPID